MHRPETKIAKEKEILCNKPSQYSPTNPMHRFSWTWFSMFLTFQRSKFSITDYKSTEVVNELVWRTGHDTNFRVLMITMTQKRKTH
jgi:hypothetical protein